MFPPDEKSLSDPAFWRGLNPSLSIEGHPSAGGPKTPLPFHDAALADLSAMLWEEGYFTLPPLFGEDEIGALRGGIERLAGISAPPVFIYLYDQPWELFARLEVFLKHFLGEDFRLLPHFWAWHVAPGSGQSGWPPHRDLKGDSIVQVPGLGEMLLSLSLWVPLSEATPENGCMSLLPLSRERTYPAPVASPAEVDLQDIRALPAKPGALMGWRQDVYHWGGRSSNLAKEPRISLSLEFQNSAFEPLAEPLLDLKNPPDFDERLALILGQFAKYRHMQEIDPDLVELIDRLTLTARHSPLRAISE